MKQAKSASTQQHTSKVSNDPRTRIIRHVFTTEILWGDYVLACV